MLENGKAVARRIARVRVNACVHQRDAAPTYDLIVRRSFSRYLGGWLSNVAAVAGQS